MTLDLDPIRARCPIQHVIGERYPLRRQGARYIGVDHDSLVVTPKTEYYFWNSRGAQGDVFDFAGRHLLGYGDRWNARDAGMFLEAVKFLADRAGILLDKDNDFRRSGVWAERELVSRLHDCLLKTPAALAYATQTRGWQSATLRAEQVGFMPADKRALLKDLHIPEKWRTVVEKFPAGMLVYVHRESGRLTYLSGRSIEGKRHYNPPAEIIGERQPYFNHTWHEDAPHVVIVEGQADAITFGGWGIPAVALGGMRAPEDLLRRVKRQRRAFVLLDNTPEASEIGRQIARALGPRAFLPTLPEGIKDANEWLLAGATREDAEALLNRAQNWLLAEVERAGRLEGLAREDALRACFVSAGDLDVYAMAQFRLAVQELGIPQRLITALMKSTPATEQPSAEVDLIADDLPVLSAAQGFSDDVGIMTVTLRERTRDNRLVLQPYLVSSARELVRLNGAQVVEVGGREIALRSIPEGGDFLMRWRYSDIQRYLAGEIVSPGEVYATLRRLLTTYLEFRSDVESHILALWTIGTYFYALFPAYPYLALNGPKNSGKSTVLRVLQPLAFNMVSTADPTGASLFRLIHMTSCTVGIDEAERYHSPRDPAMAQIRQLLNSGYKAGMPALRLIGDEHRPQTFDVYSPKILAAIAGLEDVLASRCIALPMRRTMQKLPVFPANFDGAALRHQLYTLALTAFQEVRHNYTSRPELHPLNNRSAELWSPLMALAAFFEERGGIGGLKSAVADAAQWDVELGDGRALNDREEAVLQALERMTEGGSESVSCWLTAAALREQVNRILDGGDERTNAAQWIGHVLKRLGLMDRRRRQHTAEGKIYAIDRTQVLDMMQRYDVQPLARM